MRLLEVTGTEELPDALLERLRSLESENAHLSQDADFQRKQYERCLDDIANQVVRALLSQKGLREEIGHLQRRIKELENQNQALANILMSKLECNGSAFALPSTDGKCHEAISGSPWYPGTFPNDASLPKEVEESSLSNCVDSLATKNGGVKRLRRLYLSDIIDRGDTNVNSVESLVVVPIQRPKSLNLHLRASPRSPTGAVAGVNTKRCQHKKNKLNSGNFRKRFFYYYLKRSIAPGQLWNPEVARMRSKCGGNSTDSGKNTLLSLTRESTIKPFLNHKELFTQILCRIRNATHVEN